MWAEEATHSAQISINQDKRNRYVLHSYYNATCPPSNHQSGFMTTGAPGHTYVRLHVAGIQESKVSSSCRHSKKHAYIYILYIYINVYTFYIIYINI